MNYTAWSDASVRKNLGYIAFLILDENEDIVYEYCARVSILNNYVLEKLALCLVIGKVNELGIERECVEIYTDYKHILAKLNNKRSDAYNQFCGLIGGKILHKYNGRVRYKNSKRNKAHKLSQVNCLNWFDYNLARKFT